MHLKYTINHTVLCLIPYKGQLDKYTEQSYILIIMSSRYISTTVLAATAAAFTLFGSGGIAMAYETSNKGQSLSTNEEVNTFDINFHSEELYSTYGRHDDGREDEEVTSSAPDKVGIALSNQYHTYGGGGVNDDQSKPPKLAGKAEKTSAPTVSPIDDESSATSYFGKLLISLHLRCVCVCVVYVSCRSYFVITQTSISFSSNSTARAIIIN